MHFEPRFYLYESFDHINAWLHFEAFAIYWSKRILSGKIIFNLCPYFNIIYI